MDKHRTSLALGTCAVSWFSAADVVTAALLVVGVVFLPVSGWVASTVVSAASTLNGPPGNGPDIVSYARYYMA